MCQFPPTWQFSSNSHVTVFPSSMCIYLHSQCLMSTFQYLLGSSCSIQCLLIPTAKMVFLLIQSATVQGLVPCERAHNHGEGLQKLCTGTDGRLFWFCLFLKTYDIFFKCFVISASSGPLWLFWFIWKTGYSLTSQIFSISAAAQIAYRVWVLEVIGTTEQKGSGRETKLKVRKHKQKQIQCSSIKHELMVQVCCTRITKIDSWCMHGLDRKNCLWNNGFIIMVLWYLSCCQNDKCYLCVCIQWQY